MALPPENSGAEPFAGRDGSIEGCHVAGVDDPIVIARLFAHAFYRVDVPLRLEKAFKKRVQKSVRKGVEKSTALTGLFWMPLENKDSEDNSQTRQRINSQRTERTQDNKISDDTENKFGQRAPKTPEPRRGEEACCRGSRWR